MKNYILFSIASVISTIISCTPSGTKSVPQQIQLQPMEIADNGKPLFEEKCIACHGADGTAGITNAANLQTSKLDTISIIRMITHGKNAMPAFKDQLGTGEIEQITNYVFTLRK